MVIDAITETGATYRIDLEDRLWLKMRNGLPVDATQKIWGLKVSKHELETLMWPTENDGIWEDADRPVEGRNMYIAGRDSWYVTTTVKAVIESQWDGVRNY